MICRAACTISLCAALLLGQMHPSPGPTRASYAVAPESCADPTFDPVAGSYYPGQSVTIASATAGATICYTTDDSDPTATTPGTCANGTTYSTPVSVATSDTLKALATKAALTNSAVVSAAYVIYTNLLTSPDDITNGAWVPQDATVSNSTTWVAGASGDPSLFQSGIAVSAGTTYTATVTMTPISTEAGGKLVIYDTSWNELLSTGAWLDNDVPHVLSGTFNAGANTTVRFSVTSFGSTSQTYTVTGMTIHQ